MRVIAEPLQSKDLKPGDLYSEHNQEWWDNRDSTSIGHFVIIRNSNPFPEGYQGNVSYKITITQDDLPSEEETNQFQIDAAAEAALIDASLEAEGIAATDLVSKCGGTDANAEDPEEASDDTTLITR